MKNIFLKSKRNNNNITLVYLYPWLSLTESIELNIFQFRKNHIQNFPGFLVLNWSSGQVCLMLMSLRWHVSKSVKWQYIKQIYNKITKFFSKNSSEPERLFSFVYLFLIKLFSQGDNFLWLTCYGSTYSWYLRWRKFISCSSTNFNELQLLN